MGGDDSIFACDINFLMMFGDVHGIEFSEKTRAGNVLINTVTNKVIDKKITNNLKNDIMEDFKKLQKELAEQKRINEMLIAQLNGEKIISKEENMPVNEFKVKEVEAKEKLFLKMVEYSEKSFAVIGDTKEIKGNLKEMGGRFNKFLSCGAGWIFSNKKREEVEILINNL